MHVIADNMIELENRHRLDTWNVIIFTAGEHGIKWHIMDSFFFIQSSLCHRKSPCSKLTCRGFLEGVMVTGISLIVQFVDKLIKSKNSQN